MHSGRGSRGKGLLMSNTHDFTNLNNNDDRSTENSGDTGNIDGVNGVGTSDNTENADNTGGIDSTASTDSTASADNTGSIADADGASTTKSGDHPQSVRALRRWLRSVDGLVAHELDERFAEAGASRRDLRVLNMLTRDDDRSKGRLERLERHGKRLWSLADRGWIEHDNNGWRVSAMGIEAQVRLTAISDEVRERIENSVSPADLAVTLTSLEAIAREFGWTEDMRGRRNGRGPGFGPGRGHGHGHGHGRGRGHGHGHGHGRGRGHGRGHGFDRGERFDHGERFGGGREFGQGPERGFGPEQSFGPERGFGAERGFRPERGFGDDRQAFGRDRGYEHTHGHDHGHDRGHDHGYDRGHDNGHGRGHQDGHRRGFGRGRGPGFGQAQERGSAADRGQGCNCGGGAATWEHTRGDQRHRAGRREVFERGFSAGFTAARTGR